ncbi:cytochrome ubiquinol oxidase subunit I [Rhodohalobacter sulfatireducens]|uniref:Cytochrome ubiquinol oxidase subunit I n=1 Tax=Rhodohalobacter sulfatireducens TaxID=2911366 RepID=A0ABS9KIJ9_9BACT|nr:cytochrome ubiquinol oxidase subunit I [Rhodohalobacter sulfatireducens]MCG2590680.1 cytochrome ubiquinol oxidase subunit I [Rhodohalobacter sulfatireducens]
MEDLLAARPQMAVPLGFHIIFACIGMAMPFLIAITEYKWIKTGEKVYLDLAKAWLKGVAIVFATGAVSGTALSFELGLLRPTFMEHTGPVLVCLFRGVLLFFLV